MEHKEEGMRFGMLVYRCNICKNDYPAAEGDLDEHCVYKKESKALAANILIDKSMIHDPTLSRSKGTICQMCRHDEVVFFQDTASKANSNSLASLIYICCNLNCGHNWQHEPSTEPIDDESDSD
mmetsp:Transcript_30191/g.29683  ORF Transcript_30191/g.29683 Transcript_30191/m.29683 type:complete len:124 (+) Transcript_30191:53-424(+)|eukprot:CAMPEP_0196995366 /NCGR_PEP_ID=MMETSP1380-20130617/1501_1 /TAXON_ID=5936 /ORGANISM="Euplotes crassus, Strain CT5" /LENGTH=123 /DNA_ID=CAMNT_0042411021 /DNA_START=53 /DNA_END=424 /DNA_ORIENTATION=+